MKNKSINNISDFLSGRDGKDFVEEFKKPFVAKDVKETIEQQCQSSGARSGAYIELKKTQAQER